MKFKSPLISQASGSLAGTTFSRNKGGLYMRARATPTNPNSSFQQAVRAIMSQLSNVWSSTMTAAQRTAWETYAANTPLVDSLGESRPVTGLNMFCRYNVPALQSETISTPLLTAPTEFNLGEYTAPTIASVTAPSTMSLGFEATDAWCDETGSNMLIYASRPQGPAINFFKGPYRFCGMVEGDDSSAPTSPASITLPFVVAAGQKVFIKASVARVDGRLSSPFRGGATAA